MLARLALALILIPGLARSTAAQQTMPLQPGDTVKLFAPTLTANRYTPLTGVVSRIDQDDPLAHAVPEHGAARPVARDRRADRQSALLDGRSGARHDPIVERGQRGIPA